MIDKIFLFAKYESHADLPISNNKQQFLDAKKRRIRRGFIT